jgi:hypothetical protein
MGRLAFLAVFFVDFFLAVLFADDFAVTFGETIGKPELSGVPETSAMELPVGNSTSPLSSFAVTGISVGEWLEFPRQSMPINKAVKQINKPRTSVGGISGIQAGRQIRNGRRTGLIAGLSIR